MPLKKYDFVHRPNRKALHIIRLLWLCCALWTLLLTSDYFSQNPLQAHNISTFIALGFITMFVIRVHANYYRHKKR
ncbi:hypothetical protein [Psychrobacter sp. I-STPA10]|uniref:hypothetical protein n=1 Tax=Psychrobacter sp. I-STPA10 TaxID=2585769 RepID=UPI001E2A6DF1|nr:hypothetical protein [Psychrobacter sp. I-STPA10]